MAHFIDIQVTCPDQETAERIAAALVGERLVACVNVTAPVTSLYRWQGAVERAEEVLLAAKTREAHFDAVCEAVRALHPYEVPAVFAMPIAHVERAYADWLRSETREPA